MHTVEEELSEEKTYTISTVKRPSSTQTLVTFWVNNQYDVTFEIDTGACCNLLEYMKATEGSDIKQSNYAQQH